ncbi:MAG TPA: hypothetical protein VF895_08350 [Gaiellaceae bacterium]
MSAEPSGRPRPRKRRRLHRGRLVAGIALLVIVFLLGVALGQALHDNPKAGESRTFDRTFQPFPPAETVTVTTTSP